MSKKYENDNFAIVKFKADENQPHKRLVEVINYAWLTDEGDKCFCPNPKYWSYELKNHGLPREDWVKYPCRVLKCNIATIKAANIECRKRMNYTTSEFSDHEVAQTLKVSENIPDTSAISNYNDLFDKIQDESIISSPPEMISIDKDDTNITETNPVNNVIYAVQYDALQTALQELSELRNSNQTLLSQVAELKNSNQPLLLKIDHVQSNMEKVMAQNETMMKIQMESCKKFPNSSSFTPVANINSKEKLDELEIQLENEEFFQNMAYAYTQYAFKGDAKKVVNGFTKSILIKLLDDKFSQQLKWDRVKKLEESADTLANVDVSNKIFFKKYTKMLDFVTEVCNKNRKDLRGLYNKDNISQATQDYFKRQNYMKKTNFEIRVFKYFILY